MVSFAVPIVVVLLFRGDERLSEQGPDHHRAYEQEYDNHQYLQEARFAAFLRFFHHIAFHRVRP